MPDSSVEFRRHLQEPTTWALDPRLEGRTSMVHDPQNDVARRLPPIGICLSSSGMKRHVVSSSTKDVGFDERETLHGRRGEVHLDPLHVYTPPTAEDQSPRFSGITIAPQNLFKKELHNNNHHSRLHGEREARTSMFRQNISTRSSTFSASGSLRRRS